MRLLFTALACLLSVSLSAQGLSIGDTNVTSQENTPTTTGEKQYGEELCVKNRSTDRFPVVIWYKDEVIETTSVGGHGQYCFEIGRSEREGEFRVSKGMKGKKEHFRGGIAYVD